MNSDPSSQSVARMKEDMIFLTNLRPYRNYLNPDSLQRVVHRICERLLPFGYHDPIFQAWTPEGIDTEYTNVIFRYNPGMPRKLIVGAHYDVCGDQPGADDNGSAVVGLLETARRLAERQPDLDYTVELVWYCLEEPPFFGTPDMGSYVHAESCRKDISVKTIGMINFEMIGYFSDRCGSQVVPYGDIEGIEEVGDVGDFICAVGIRRHEDFTRFVASCMQRHPGIRTHGIIFDDPNGWAGLSDQRNYWTFGIPALMINNTAMLRNPHYHQPSDDYDTIDFKRMADVVQAAWEGIVRLGEMTAS